MVFFDTINGLRERGHEVIEFSMQGSRNLPSEYAAYFAPEIPEFTSKQSWGSDWATFKNIFHSQDVANKLKTLIDATEPEVAHLHNATRQLSASVFFTLKKAGLPIALTVHDVQPMCPNHRMLRGGDIVCEKCFKHKYYNCTRYNCINKSRSQSLTGTLEAYYYYLKGIWKFVDAFICPSEFMLDKLVKWGFPAKKMHLLRNPYAGIVANPSLGSKIVYMGRLHEEKGINIFLAALPELKNYPIIIAGNGPEEENVEKFIRQNGLNNVERVGWVGGEKWQEVMNEARVVVVPSLFYENCSISILEALGNGKLVVASDRGGNRELIINETTGWLVEPENPKVLAEAIGQAMRLNTAEADKIIANAKNLLRQNHNPEGYFQKLEEIYATL